MDLETLLKTDWSFLDTFKDQRIYCLKEISTIKTKDDVIQNLLPLLSDEDASSLVLNLSLRLELPEYFLPLYIHYLNRYRVENNIDYVKKFERIIRDYIAKMPVNI